MWIEQSTDEVKRLGIYGRDAAKAACKEALERKNVGVLVTSLDDIYAALEQFGDVKWLKEKIAFAEGKVIQFKDYQYRWNDLHRSQQLIPVWDESDWRIKPAPKPDVVKEWRVIPNGVEFSHYHGEPNIKVTFDGETGKLIKAEILK